MARHNGSGGRQQGFEGSVEHMRQELRVRPRYSLDDFLASAAIPTPPEVIAPVTSARHIGRALAERQSYIELNRIVIALQRTGVTGTVMPDPRNRRFELFGAVDVAAAITTPGEPKAVYAAVSGIFEGLLAADHDPSKASPAQVNLGRPSSVTPLNLRLQPVPEAVQDTEADRLYQARVIANIEPLKAHSAQRKLLYRQLGDTLGMALIDPDPRAIFEVPVATITSHNARLHDEQCATAFAAAARHVRHEVLLGTAELLLPLETFET